MSAFAYIGAALAEIAGCFAFWAWLRLDKSVWWLAPGTASLCLFAYVLTLVDAEHAGRTYAAYGGVYILSALLWLWVAEDVKPDRWDAIGAAVCLLGAAIILLGPRPLMSALGAKRPSCHGCFSLRREQAGQLDWLGCRPCRNLIGRTEAPMMARGQRR